jgi:hypothetical protein
MNAAVIPESIAQLQLSLRIGRSGFIVPSFVLFMNCSAG